MSNPRTARDLIQAAQVDDLVTVKECIETYKIAVDAVDHTGETALQWVIYNLYRGKFVLGEVAEYLLSKGADIFKSDRSGHIVLNYEISSTIKLEIAKALKLKLFEHAYLQVIKQRNLELREKFLKAVESNQRYFDVQTLRKYRNCNKNFEQQLTDNSLSEEEKNAVRYEAVAFYLNNNELKTADKFAAEITGKLPTKGFPSEAAWKTYLAATKLSDEIQAVIKLNDAAEQGAEVGRLRIKAMAAPSRPKTVERYFAECYSVDWKKNGLDSKVSQGGHEFVRGFRAKSLIDKIYYAQASRKNGYLVGGVEEIARYTQLNRPELAAKIKDVVLDFAKQCVDISNPSSDRDLFITWVEAKSKEVSAAAPVASSALNTNAPAPAVVTVSAEQKTVVPTAVTSAAVTATAGAATSKDPFADFDLAFSDTTSAPIATSDSTSAFSFMNSPAAAASSASSKPDPLNLGSIVPRAADEKALANSALEALLQFSSTSSRNADKKNDSKSSTAAPAPLAASAPALFMRPASTSSSAQPVSSERKESDRIALLRALTQSSTPSANAMIELADNYYDAADVPNAIDSIGNMIKVLEKERKLQELEKYQDRLIRLKLVATDAEVKKIENLAELIDEAIFNIRMAQMDSAAKKLEEECNAADVEYKEARTAYDKAFILNEGEGERFTKADTEFKKKFDTLGNHYFEMASRYEERAAQLSRNGGSPDLIISHRKSYMSQLVNAFNKFFKVKETNEDAATKCKLIVELIKIMARPYAQADAVQPQHQHPKAHPADVRAKIEEAVREHAKILCRVNKMDVPPAIPLSQNRSSSFARPEPQRQPGAGAGSSGHTFTLGLGRWA